MITPSLHLCSQLKLSVLIYKCSYLSSNYTPSTYTQQNSCISHKQRCRDGVINDLLSQYRHLLVPLFFMMRHPYIPLHFREMIFPLVLHTSLHTPYLHRIVGNSIIYIFTHVHHTTSCHQLNVKIYFPTVFHELTTPQM